MIYCGLNAITTRDKCTKMQKKSPPPEKFLCQTAPSALRNASSILRVLRNILPEKCSVLEIGSGTGQHSVIFSEGIKCLKWIPTDVDASNFESITGWAQTATHNIPSSPRLIDASQPDWCLTADDNIDVIVSINVIHISPWSVTTGIFKGAQKFLPKDGFLYFYGPFTQNNVPTTAGNIAFDKSLRERNEDWGLRNIEEMEKLANKHALRLDRMVKMPSNNLSVIFTKT